MILPCGLLQCEADAVAFTEEVHEAGGGSHADWPSAALWTADGSYVLAPQQLSSLGNGKKLRLESCHARPVQEQLDARMRTRIVHHLSRRSASSSGSTTEAAAWHLDTIEVCCWAGGMTPGSVKGCSCLNSLGTGHGLLRVQRFQQPSYHVLHS